MTSSSPGLCLISTAQVPAASASVSLCAFPTDVEDIKFVINFDFPHCSEDYVHRIGRTARASNRGTSYTFFTSSNAKLAKDLISVLKEAHQQVNPKLLQMQSMASTLPGRSRRGGGGGRSGFGAKGGGGFGGSRHGGLGGPSSSGGSNGRMASGGSGGPRPSQSGGLRSVVGSYSATQQPRAFY